VSKEGRAGNEGRDEKGERVIHKGGPKSKGGDERALRIEKISVLKE